MWPNFMVLGGPMPDLWLICPHTAFGSYEVPLVNRTIECFRNGGTTANGILNLSDWLIFKNIYFKTTAETCTVLLLM